MTPRHYRWQKETTKAFGSSKSSDAFPVYADSGPFCVLAVCNTEDKAATVCRAVNSYDAMRDALQLVISRANGDASRHTFADGKRTFAGCSLTPADVEVIAAALALTEEAQHGPR